MYPNKILQLLLILTCASCSKKEPFSSFCIEGTWIHRYSNIELADNVDILYLLDGTKKQNAYLPFHSAILFKDSIILKVSLPDSLKLILGEKFKYKFTLLNSNGDSIMIGKTVYTRYSLKTPPKLLYDSVLFNCTGCIDLLEEKINFLTGKVNVKFLRGTQTFSTKDLTVDSNYLMVLQRHVFNIDTTFLNSYSNKKETWTDVPFYEYTFFWGNRSKKIKLQGDLGPNKVVVLRNLFYYLSM